MGAQMPLAMVYLECPYWQDVILDSLKYRLNNVWQYADGTKIVL